MKKSNEIQKSSSLNNLGFTVKKKNMNKDIWGNKKQRKDYLKVTKAFQYLDIHQLVVNISQSQQNPFLPVRLDRKSTRERNV